MTNQTPTVPETAHNSIGHDAKPGQLRFGMVVLYVGDLQQAIAFYRLLGLDVPAPHPEHPVSAFEIAPGVTMILATDAVAQRFDPHFARPGHGYQQVIEFFVDTDAQVDAVWNRLTSAGYYGRTAPGHLLGPYATLVDDPDGNVVLITSEPVVNTESPTPA